MLSIITSIVFCFVFFVLFCFLLFFFCCFFASLFTKVPVDETIDIMIDNVYKIPSFPSPKIKHIILRKFLLTFTTQVSFYNYHCNITIQTDSISMDSSLGPSFIYIYIYI